MRWARVSTDASIPEDRPGPPVATLAKGLDWDAFSGRYFAGHGRHDAQARSAYAAYRQAAAASGATVLRPVAEDSAAERSAENEGMPPGNDAVSRRRRVIVP